MRYTPNHWKARGPNDKGNYMITDFAGRDVAEIMWQNNAEGRSAREEVRIKAQLIAAAPELREKCKTILARLDLEAAEQGEGAVFLCAAMREGLRSLIAKAEGTD